MNVLFATPPELGGIAVGFLLLAGFLLSLVAACGSAHEMQEHERKRRQQTRSEDKNGNL